MKVTTIEPIQYEELEILNSSQTVDENGVVCITYTIKPAKPLDYVEIDPNIVFRKDGTPVAIRG